MSEVSEIIKAESLGAADWESSADVIVVGYGVAGPAPRSRPSGPERMC